MRTVFFNLALLLQCTERIARQCLLPILTILQSGYPRHIYFLVIKVHSIPNRDLLWISNPGVTFIIAHFCADHHTAAHFVAIFTAACLTAASFAATSFAAPSFYATSSAESSLTADSFSEPSFSVFFFLRLRLLKLSLMELPLLQLHVLRFHFTFSSGILLGSILDAGVAEIAQLCISFNHRLYKVSTLIAPLHAEIRMLPMHDSLDYRGRQIFSAAEAPKHPLQEVFRNSLNTQRHDHTSRLCALL